MLNLDNLLPDEVNEILDAIKEDFKIVNYKSYNDDLLQIEMLDTSQFDSHKEIGTILVQMYRRHIDIVLSMQGIHITDYENVPISLLAKVLNAVCILGTSSIVDLGATGIDFTVSEQPVEYIVRIISNLTSIPEEILITLIHDVNDEVITYLETGEHSGPISSIISVHSLSRVKRNIDITSSNPISAIFKDMSELGYDLSDFVLAHFDCFSNINDSEVMVNSIVTTVLGSSTSDHELHDKALEIADTILEDRPAILLTVNAKLSKLFEGKIL